jgi:hypothetical protein
MDIPELNHSVRYATNNQTVTPPYPPLSKLLLDAQGNRQDETLSKHNNC